MNSTAGRRIILTLGESRVVGTLVGVDNKFVTVIPEHGDNAHYFHFIDGWTARYPVEVPTKPYAVVVPPDEDQGTTDAFVLEPLGDGITGWFRCGIYSSKPEVAYRLANGWRVVFEGVEQ